MQHIFIIKRLKDKQKNAVVKKAMYFLFLFMVMIFFLELICQKRIKKSFILILKQQKEFLNETAHFCCSMFTLFKKLFYFILKKHFDFF